MYECVGSLIPFIGNHDPRSLFRDGTIEPRSLSNGSINIDRLPVRLARDLVLLGVGGSVAAYFAAEPAKAAWPGRESR